MHEYKTIVEKSAEWNMTPRRIQYLCKNGRVEGAVKRAATWFIPEDAPSPATNTKKDATGFDFVGSKKRLFESAINLFLMRGYDNVSMKDIAASVGLRQSTVYNHFGSKQEILDTIYDYFCHYYLDNRLSLEELEPHLANDSLESIIGYVRYEFKDPYREKLSDIIKIILQRISIDERAREIGNTLIIGAGMKYVEDIFERLKDLGRFRAIDSYKMAVHLNGARIFAMVRWIMDPSLDNMIRLTEDEVAAYNDVAGFVSDAHDRYATASVEPRGLSAHHPSTENQFSKG